MPYDRTASQLAATVIARAAVVMEHPADLLNVAIEELVKERYELPAFSTLDRLVGHVRSVTNNRLFQRVGARLSELEQVYLDLLLEPNCQNSVATLNLLKSPPKRATLSHLKELLKKFNQLISFGDARQKLSAIAPTKVKYFAAFAKSLDSSELREFKPSKRRTLVLCLLYQAQVKTRDHLVEMFLKRIQTIQNQAKTRLQELREQHLAQTEALLGVLSQILAVSHETPDATTLGNQVQSVLEGNGGAALLLQQCEEISAYNTRNYLPLLWRFYSRHRKSLFELVRSLDIRSTTSEESVIEALVFVLENEHRRSKWFPATIELNFISDAWRRLVVTRRGDTEVLVRQHLEICLFVYLAMELKTGDACVVGSENYADFREQLLSWSECESLVEDYCQSLGIPSDSVQFVEYLQQKLTLLARKVDLLCQSGDQVTINREGEPVLKRIPALPQPEGAEQLEAAILQRLPERSLLDILCNVEHWLHAYSSFWADIGVGSEI